MKRKLIFTVLLGALLVVLSHSVAVCACDDITVENDLLNNVAEDDKDVDSVAIRLAEHYNSTSFSSPPTFSSAIDENSHIENVTEIQLDIGVENEVQLSQDEVNGIELVENEVLLPEAALGDSLDSVSRDSAVAVEILETATGTNDPPDQKTPPAFESADEVNGIELVENEVLLPEVGLGDSLNSVSRDSAIAVETQETATGTNDPPDQKMPPMAESADKANDIGLVENEVPLPEVGLGDSLNSVSRDLAIAVEIQETATGTNDPPDQKTLPMAESEVKILAKKNLVIHSFDVAGESSHLETYTDIVLVANASSDESITSYTYCILNGQGGYQVIYHGETPKTTYKFTSPGDYMLYAKVTDASGSEAHHTQWISVDDLRPAVSLLIDDVAAEAAEVWTIGLNHFDLKVARVPEDYQQQMYLVYPKGNYQIMPQSNWVKLKFYYPGQYIMRADVSPSTGGSFTYLFPFQVKQAPPLQISKINITPEHDELVTYEKINTQVEYQSPFTIKHFTFCLLDRDHSYSVFYHGSTPRGTVRIVEPGRYHVLVKVKDIYGRSTQNLQTIDVRQIDYKISLLINDEPAKPILSETKHRFEMKIENLPVSARTNLVLIAPDGSYRILPTGSVTTLALDEIGKYTMKAYIRPSIGGLLLHTQTFQVDLVPLNFSDLTLTPRPIRIRQKTNILPTVVGAKGMPTVFSYWLKTPQSQGFTEVLRTSRLDIDWTFDEIGKHQLIVLVTRADRQQMRRMVHFQVLIDLPWAEITQIRADDYKDYGTMAYGIKLNDGTHVMIDGGVHRPEEDEEYSIYNADGSIDPVYSYIKNELDGRVDVWLVTHFHDDHFGNAANIYNNCSDITIKSFVGVTPTASDKMKEVCFGEYMQETLEKIKERGIWREVCHGQVLTYGEMKIEVMHDLHQVSNRWNFNDTTTIFRLNLGRTNKKFIVLGDLYLNSGDVFLANHSAAQLKSDIVSVAHHGIKGVAPIVYDRIRAPIAFIPSFAYTYNNDFWLYKTKPAVYRWANLIIHGVDGTYTLKV